MTRAHLLDRLIGDEMPPLRTAAEVASFETIPYIDRIAAQSTFDVLRLSTAHDPDAAAFHFLQNADPDETPRTITYAQFLSRVTQAANFFTELGVGRDDVVSLLLPLLPQTFFAQFGAQVAGIVNPVNPLLSPGQIAAILRAAKSKVLVALGPAPGSDIWEKVQRIKGELPDLKAIVVVHGAADAADGAISFDASIDAYPTDHLTCGRHIAAEDTAAYFHTGGTTGAPKLVRHTHRNQVYHAWAMGLMMPVSKGRTFLFGLPLFHVGGALTHCLAALGGGGALVVVSPAGWRDPKAMRNVWRLVERYKPFVFAGVPTVFGAALNVPSAGADVSSIGCLGVGGSALPVAIGKAYFEWLGTPVLEGYGMTETSSVHTFSYARRPLRLGSVGHGMPYSKVRVVKVDAGGGTLPRRLCDQRNRCGGDGGAGRLLGLPRRSAQPGRVRRTRVGELG